MSTIYIVSDHGVLKKKNETLHLVDSDGTITMLFPYKTEQLIIMGNVEITSPALKLLMKHNIDTIFLSKNGKFNGKLVFQESKNIFLRQKQYRLLDNEDFKVTFAKDIVRGKLKNQLLFMQRINRKNCSEANTKDIKLAISRMKKTIERLEAKRELNKIRGIEGIGARYYFSVFRHNIIQDWAVFNGRSMHPPKDNVNAVLSFLYTLVFFRIDAIITAEGLDSYAGYFHVMDYGRRSLSFDLMEEFRTPIADTLTCAMFNLGILKEDDFQTVTFSTDDSEEYMLQRDNSAEDGESSVIQNTKGVLLTKSGLRKVITQFEKKLETQYYYEPLLKRVSYKKLLFEQVKSFKRIISGEENHYKPMVIK